MDIAIRLQSPGGIEQLEMIEWSVQAPGPGEIRLRHTAIGVNFLDIYHRTGVYPLSAPAILGVEGAGVVEALGEGVTGLSIGQKVAYAGQVGGYASTRLLPAWRAVALPDKVPPALAAASMLRGMTASMLLTRTFPVGPGTRLLIHAAAGGLGTILTRWAKSMGAEVIGTTSTQDKAQMARASGADHIIVGRDSDIVTEVARLTGGVGVDFAIDGIGGTTLAKTLGCVRRFGLVASIGQAAGPIPSVAVEALGPVRSLSLARPSVMAYATEKASYAAGMAAVIAMLAAGGFAEIGPEYALANAGQAQTSLETGQTLGSIILRP